MATATNISGASPAWHSSLATFFPGYFALVLATGIVSLSAHFLGHEYIAQALLWLSVFAYAVLWAITFIRFVCYRAQNRKPREGGGFSFVHLRQDSDILRSLAKKLRDMPTSTGTLY